MNAPDTIIRPVFSSLPQSQVMGSFLGYQDSQDDWSGLDILEDRRIQEDENIQDEGSGLEMVHISDCLDYFG